MGRESAPEQRLSPGPRVAREGPASNLYDAGQETALALGWVVNSGRVRGGVGGRMPKPDPRLCYATPPEERGTWEPESEGGESGHPAEGNVCAECERLARQVSGRVRVPVRVRGVLPSSRVSLTPSPPPPPAPPGI